MRTSLPQPDDTLMRKRRKYWLLQYLPGSRGRRYSRKYKAVLALEEFELAICQSAGKTCIDLGANIGQYTRKMALIAKEVIAFEPDPWAVGQLRNNLRRFTNVRIENAAASTRNGTGVLWRRDRFDDNPSESSMSSSIVKRKINPARPGQEVMVHLIDFVEYIDQLGEGTTIGTVKMDIEGEELDILDALLRRRDLLSRIDYIFVETHERQIPDQKDRVEELRRTIRDISHPRINLDWH